MTTSQCFHEGLAVPINDKKKFKIDWTQIYQVNLHKIMPIKMDPRSESEKNQVHKHELSEVLFEISKETSCGIDHLSYILACWKTSWR